VWDLQALETLVVMMVGYCVFLLVGFSRCFSSFNGRNTGFQNLLIPEETWQKLSRIQPQQSR